jgi:hypothetical protein
MGCDTARIGIPVAGAASAVVAWRLPFPLAVSCAPSSLGAGLGPRGDRGGIGRPPFRLSRPACPRTVVPTIAGLHPLPACVRVSALCPAPAHLPWGISHLVTDVRGRTGPVIMRPSPYDRVACLDFLPCRGVLMCVQIGSQRSHVLEHFCLLWDGPPFALFPAFPAVQPQEVQPFWARHDPGCGFPARQAAGLQELF